MKIDKLMTQEVRSCRQDDPLNRAAQTMWDHDCGAVPVVDGESKLLGMITDRDVCMAAYFRGRPLEQIRVSEAMSRGIYALTTGDGVDTALDLMETHKVRRLPVVDEQGRLAGIVSLADLVREAGRKFAGGRKVKADAIVAALRGICAPAAKEPEVLVVEVRPQARDKAARTSSSAEGTGTGAGTKKTSRRSAARGR